MTAYLHNIRVSEGLAGTDVGFEDVSELFDSVSVLQDLHVLGRLVDDSIPNLTAETGDIKIDV